MTRLSPNRLYKRQTQGPPLAPSHGTPQGPLHSRHPPRNLQTPSILPAAVASRRRHGNLQFPEDLDRNNPPHDTYKTRRLTLARAARTCKAFTNSASRVLWEVLDEIEHIISVLRTAQVSHSCNSVFFRNAEVARHLTAKWTPPVVHDSRTFAAASALCRSRLDHRKPWATCSR